MNANNHQHYVASSHQQPQGPRAKCDQVIFEAIAKAAEIIVRGRCARLSSDGNGNNIHNSSMYHPHYQPDNQTTHHQYAPQPSFGASSGRFNIQVEEVQAVRSTLQRWKQSLHVPLRLDVYYQYKEPSSNSNGENSSNNGNVRRELLERWCIDYIASKPNNHHHSSQNGNAMMDDSSVLLRSVCKRIVIFLRTLYSMTRIMPGYKLHQALLQLQQQDDANNYQNRTGGLYGGTGNVAAGYYASHSYDRNHNRGSSCSRQEGMVEDDEGSVHFSFYASTTEGDALSLFSSTSNSPFSRRELNSVPTPFGMLHLTVLYDASLNVERALLKKLHFQKNRLSPDANKNPHHPSSAYPSHSSVSKAIPIASHTNSIDKRASSAQVSNSLPVSRIIDNYAVSPNHSNSNNDRPVTNVMPKSYNSKNSPRLQQQSLLQAQSYSPQTNRRTYRKMHSDSEQQYNHARLMLPINRNKNTHNNSNDADNHLQKPKRAVSGLSLALMEDDSSVCVPSSNSTGKSPSQLIPNDCNNTPPSPISLARVYSGGDDSTTAWRQRLALHHPPPTVEMMSSANHLHSRDYGYGYNNSNNAVAIRNPPSTNNNISAPPSPGNSAYPLSNTPPQPMFIGSGPRNSLTSSPYQPPPVTTKSKEESKSKASREGRISPPFRENPTSLKKSDIDINSTSTLQNNDINYSSKSTQNQPLTSRKNIKNLAISPSNSEHQQWQNGKRPSDSNILLPPLTSLDVLTTSPFKTSPLFCDHTTNGSILSSLSVNNNVVSSSALYGPTCGERSYATAGNPYNNNNSYSSSMMAWSTRPQSGSNSNNTSMFRSSATAGVFDSLYNPHNKSIPDVIQTDYSFDDMPFAVDGVGETVEQGNTQTNPTHSDISKNTAKTSPQNTTKSQNELGSSSVNTASSHLITSLAHRCATAGRLKLFTNTHNDQNNVDAFSSLSGNNENITSYSHDELNIVNNVSASNLNNNNDNVVDSHYVDTVSSLADQLAEFRSFGASLATKTSSSTRVHATTNTAVETGGGSKVSSFSNR